MVKRLQMLLALLSLSIGFAIAQTQTVTGTVFDEAGEPVIGASVLVQGTTLGAITNIDGQFTINNVPSSATMVQVSYVGLKTVQVSISRNMQIVLESDAALLDEVIVVAYGTAKKSSFTGSAAVVGEQALEKRALTNVMSALEGNAPGVQVTSGNGQPGESPSIRIRGFGTINGSSAPLYVVDGAIFNGSLSDLNPNDIESMTVLKDAASTALYGSSAGNGVVLITTKTAKGANKTSVTFDAKVGFSGRGIKDYKKVGYADTYLTGWEMLKNNYINGGGQDPATAAQMASDNLVAAFGGYNIFAGVDDNALVSTSGVLNPSASRLKWGDDTDWEDAVYRTGVRQDYNVSLTTKTDKSDAFASFGYLKELGNQVETDFQRFSGRANLNVYPVSWFKGGVNVAGTKTSSSTNSSNSDSTSSYVNLSRWVRYVPSIYPVHAHDLDTGALVLDNLGNPQYDYKGSRTFSTGRDALAEAFFNDPRFNRNMVQGRVYADFMFLKGFTISLNATLNSNDNRSSQWENTQVGDGNPSGRMRKQSTRSTIYTFNQLLKYENTFGKHNVDVLVGHENYDYEYNYFYAMKTGVILDVKDGGAQELDNMVNIASLSSYTDRYTKEGYLGRLNYNYADKYYASVSFRRDGTSRFSPDARWGNFWSFGASWRIDQEEFMKALPWVNSLKLRASYGETGNDNLGSYYLYQTLYGSGYNNKNEPGLYFSSFGNSDLHWETQISKDLGLEFGLFDRLTGTIEYFEKNSKDLLFNVPTPYSTGASSVRANIGKVVNHGFEIDLNYQILRSSDWKASVGVNATLLKNEIKRLPDDQRETGIIDGTKKYLEGHSIYDFWLRQYEGVNPDNGDPAYLFDEENATWNDATCYEKGGVKYTSNINLAKYDYSGSAIPDVQGGFNFNVSWKNLDLSAVFSYSLGSKIYNSNYAGLMANAISDAWHPDILNAWKKPGDVTNVPRLDNSNATNANAGTSTRWLMSGDYLSFRTLSIGYTIPRKFLQSLGAGFQSARLSFTGENLFQWNAMQGLNAQETFNGTTANVYYPSRTFTFGLNVSF